VQRAAPLVWAAASVVLTLMLVLYPAKALEAARDGMDLFLRVVFPSLFPFFVLSDIMLGLGVVHFIGVLFTPLMRPLFNVPGEGAFALSMGLAAGYPMDAVITARFRKQAMCTRVEGERLLAFTNTADPLFIWGAVAAGMFAIPAIGNPMALGHYMGALVVGILFRFYGTGSREQPVVEKREEGQILARAVRALLEARREDGRHFGQMMGDAVNDSIKTLLMICGFIMLFSTVVKILEVVGAEQLIAWPFRTLLPLLGMDPVLVKSLVRGLFEIDLGAVEAARAQAPLVQRVAVAGAIIAWSGLSVHGQVASVLTGTDIRMGPYALARLLHAVFAGVFTLLLLDPAMLSGALSQMASTFGPLPPAHEQIDVWLRFQRGLTGALVVPLGLTLAGAAVAVMTGGIRWFGFQVRR
jgi:sporulation integral membrane protein YlbJ